MMKRLTLALAALLSVGVLAFAVPTASAAEEVYDQACKVGGAKDSPACTAGTADPITGTGGILAKVTRLIAYIAGIAAFILMIISGIMFINSNGDPSKVAGARNTAIYAVIGLVVIILAQGIIVFLLNRVAK